MPTPPRRARARLRSRCAHVRWSPKRALWRLIRALMIAAAGIGPAPPRLPPPGPHPTEQVAEDVSDDET